MCGIIGYVGNDNFINIAKKSLLNLEYRGYDSAGISFFNGDKIITIKSVGQVEKLFEKINIDSSPNCGIGHTRWATNGKPCHKNCHPHASENKQFYIVHNGIIENCDELKNTFLSNVKLKSDTDTEILVNLIEYNYKKYNDVLTAINKTIKLIKGSYAIALINRLEQNKIYFARNQSPLLIGVNKTEKFISSDILGFNGKVKNYYILPNDCYGFISNTKFVIFDKFENIIEL